MPRCCSERCATRGHLHPRIHAITFPPRHGLQPDSKPTPIRGTLSPVRKAVRRQLSFLITNYTSKKAEHNRTILWPRPRLHQPPLHLPQLPVNIGPQQDAFIGSPTNGFRLFDAGGNLGLSRRCNNHPRPARSCSARAPVIPQEFILHPAPHPARAPPPVSARSRLYPGQSHRSGEHRL